MEPTIAPFQFDTSRFRSAIMEFFGYDKSFRSIGWHPPQRKAMAMSEVVHETTTEYERRTIP